MEKKFKISAGNVDAESLAIAAKFINNLSIALDAAAKELAKNAHKKAKVELANKPMQKKGASVKGTGEDRIDVMAGKIASLRAKGLSIADIAARVHKHKSFVSKKLNELDIK